MPTKILTLVTRAKDLQEIVGPFYFKEEPPSRRIVSPVKKLDESEAR